jgi:hypothetical protein
MQSVDDLPEYAFDEWHQYKTSMAITYISLKGETWGFMANLIHVVLSLYNCLASIVIESYFPAANYGFVFLKYLSFWIGYGTGTQVQAFMKNLRYKLPQNLCLSIVPFVIKTGCLENF